jgi:hypothetical protein
MSSAFKTRPEGRLTGVVSGAEKPAVATRRDTATINERQWRQTKEAIMPIVPSRAGRLHELDRRLSSPRPAGVLEALAPLVDAVVDEEAALDLRLLILDEILRLEPPLPRSTLRPLGRRLATSRVPGVAARGAELPRGPGRGRARPKKPVDPVARRMRGKPSASEVAQLADTLRREADPPLDRLHEGLEAYAAIARRHRIRRSSPALRRVRPEHRAALETSLLESRPRRR